MEGSLVSKNTNNNEQEFNLKEWHLRARISKESSSNSRRYSSSYIRSFREDSSRSFRSNFTISSTASSPGYPIKDEIDPSTYSFTTALKALQARSGYVWECLSPEGFALNSKWNEAERYICNPLSGEVPMECLSAKTLSGRSFRSYMASRVTMSAPLVYSLQPRRTSTTTATTFSSNNNNSGVCSDFSKEQLVKPPHLIIQEKDIGCRTRDVGIQSTNSTHGEGEGDQGSSSSPSDVSTPSIRERRPIIRSQETEEDHSENINNSSSSIMSNVILPEVEVKVTREGEGAEETKKTRGGSQKKKKMHKKGQQLCLCNCTQQPPIGCSLLSSWKTLLMKRWHQEKTSITPGPTRPDSGL